MLTQSKICLCILFFLGGTITTNAQKACCASGSKEQTTCEARDSKAQAGDAKACCASSTTATTSGCTPSSCRGAKTKFGEAKVITDLRHNLIALKRLMEGHKNFKFSDQAITVHDIVGETDDESLKIVSEHIGLMETEIFSFVKQEIPESTPAENKAVQLQQLQERIASLSQLL